MEPPLSDRRILILEDEQILYRFVEAYFAELGPRYVVSSGSSVSAAIEIFKRSPIDLVVLDHQRPGKLDGLELLREIRRKALPIQVVLVADKGSEGDGITALAMGCTNFLVKPFSYETMAELLFQHASANRVQRPSSRNQAGRYHSNVLLPKREHAYQSI
jgi:DNA-binding response OmpR family regulator